MGFDPQVGQKIEIEDENFYFIGNPSAPNIPYGQEGRAATVYKLESKNKHCALKVFKTYYRVPSLVSLSSRLSSFAGLPGLTICQRTVLTSRTNKALLRQYPDLSYAVLMPWVVGPTWLEILSNREPLPLEQSHQLAYTLANMLSDLEQQGIAHCDLSSANLMLPTLARADGAWAAAPIELVDIEGIYARGLDEPEFISNGTDGYAHYLVRDGKIWNALADRFSGAILLSEILGYCDPIICQSAWCDSYFIQDELQKPCQRYDQLLISLQKHWGERIAQLFARTWNSDRLADCPTFDDWLLAIPDQVVDQLSIEQQPTSFESTDKRDIREDKPKVEDCRMEVSIEPETGDLQDLLSKEEKGKQEYPAIIQLDPPSDPIIKMNLEREQTPQELDHPKGPQKPPLARVIFYTVGFMALMFIVALLNSIINSGKSAPEPIDNPLPGPVLIDDMRISPNPITPSPTLTPTPTITVSPTPTIDTSTRAGDGLPGSLKPISIENAAQVVELTRWGKGAINQMAYSSDGKLLAVATDIGIYLYDGETFAEIKFISTEKSVGKISFSPDGTFIAGSLSDKAWHPSTLSLWRIGDWENILTQEAHSSEIESITFSPDGTMIATVAYDNFIKLWSVKDAHLIRDFPGRYSIAFSPDGQFLAGGTEKENAINIWRVNDGNLVRKLAGNQSIASIASIAFSPDGSLLASQSRYPRSIKLWQVSDGELLQTIDESDVYGHLDTNLSFSPDGKLLAGWSEKDKIIKIWNTNDGSEKASIKINPGSLCNLSFLPNGQNLVTATGDGKVRLIRITDGAILNLINNFEENINSLALSENGDLLAVGTGDTEDAGLRNAGEVGTGSLNVINVFTGVIQQQIEQPKEITQVSISPDGSLVSSCSFDGNTNIFRVSDGDLEQTLEGHYLCDVLSPDWRFYARYINHDKFELLNRTDGSLKLPLLSKDFTGIPKGYARKMFFSPDARFFSAFIDDDTLKIWDVESGAEIISQKERLRTDPVFTLDGKFIVGGLRENTIRFWSTENGAIEQTIWDAKNLDKSLAISPDGQILATTRSTDNDIWLIRVQDGSIITKLTGHHSEILSLIFSTNGEFLASGSGDGTIRFWGIKP